MKKFGILNLLVSFCLLSSYFSQIPRAQAQSLEASKEFSNAFVASGKSLLNFSGATFVLSVDTTLEVGAFVTEKTVALAKKTGKVIKVGAEAVLDGVVYAGKVVYQKVLKPTGRIFKRVITYTGEVIEIVLDATGELIEATVVFAGEMILTAYDAGEAVAKATWKAMKWTGKKIYQGTEVAADFVVKVVKETADGVKWVVLKTGEVLKVTWNALKEIWEATIIATVDLFHAGVELTVETAKVVKNAIVKSYNWSKDKAIKLGKTTADAAQWVYGKVRIAVVYTGDMLIEIGHALADLAVRGVEAVADLTVEVALALKQLGINVIELATAGLDISAEFINLVAGKMYAVANTGNYVLVAEYDPDLAVEEK